MLVTQSKGETHIRNVLFSGWTTKRGWGVETPQPLGKKHTIFLSKILMYSHVQWNGLLTFHVSLLFGDKG